MAKIFPDLQVNTDDILELTKDENGQVVFDFNYIVDFTGEIIPEVFQVELGNIIQEFDDSSFLRSVEKEIIFDFSDFSFKITDYSEYLRSKLQSIDPSSLPEALSYLLTCENCSVFQSKLETDLESRNSASMMNSIVGSATICDLCEAKNSSLFVQVKASGIPPFSGQLVGLSNNLQINTVVILDQSFPFDLSVGIFNTPLWIKNGVDFFYLKLEDSVGSTGVVEIKVSREGCEKSEATDKDVSKRQQLAIVQVCLYQLLLIVELLVELCNQESQIAGIR